MKKFIFTTLVLGAHAFCERANINRIDMDPRIMNWSYVGPIKSVEVHDEMLNQILLNGIGNDSVFVFDGKNYPIIDVAASSDGNFVSQIYKNIKEDDYLIGVARIFSDDDIEVAVNGWFYSTKDQLVYLNGENIEIGDFVEVKINETRTWSLTGKFQKIIEKENEAYLIGH